MTDDAQGASLWKIGAPLGKLISMYHNESKWDFVAEDPAMIWQIPKGTRIPKELRLLQLDSHGTRGAFVLQPAEPMPLLALNETIRTFQIHSSYSEPTHEMTGERVVRLYDWMTAENPLINRFPEISHGWAPDESGNSYGGKYTWDANHVIYLRRTPLPVELRAIYCPLAPIQLPSLRRALYIARLAFSNRISHEGYFAPLGPPYRTPHEAGSGCEFTATMDASAPMEHQMTVGLVYEVLSWLWEYLVKNRETRDGSIDWHLYIGISGYRSSGWGYIGPVEHPLTQRLGTE
ncbi:MAG: hypothetical protein Q9209_006583 [Squamulea sp. 1 TL-2023]